MASEGPGGSPIPGPGAETIGVQSGKVADIVNGVVLLVTSSPALPGAAVTVDDAGARVGLGTLDANGQLQFIIATAIPGIHVYTATVSGQDPVTLTIDVAGRASGKKAVKEPAQKGALPGYPLYGPLQAYDSGWVTNALAVVDEDGDGRPDVVLSGAPAAGGGGNGGVAIARGLGDGTFSPFTTSPGNASPYGRLSIVDLNADGLPDVVAVHPGSGSVDAFLDTGDGPLQAPVASVLNGQPDLITGIGSLFGAPGVAVGDRSLGTVALLPGNPTATFAAPIQVISGIAPTALAASGERLFIADGASDSLIVVDLAWDGSVADTSTIPLAGLVASPAAIAVGDVLGTTAGDVVVADAASGSAALIAMQSDGTYAAGVPIQVGYPQGAVAIADLNGDGIADLAFTLPGGRVALLPGKSDHTFLAAEVLALDDGAAPGAVPASSLAVADLIGDGLPDLIAPTATGFAVLLAQGVADGTPPAGPPVIDGFSPSGAPTTGGTLVTIYGSSFTAATAVYFGNVPATGVTVLSDGVVTCISPQQAAGAIGLYVVTPSGTSDHSPGPFDVEPVPLTITWPAPAAVPLGTVLGQAQLDATFLPALPGTVIYDPPAGTVMATGGDQVLTVSFIPDDASIYEYTSATVTLSVLGEAQTVTFAPIADRVYDLTTTPISASASSGLPVHVSVASGPATMQGDAQVQVTGLGTVTITATQAGDAGHQAASATRSFTVLVNPVLTGGPARVPPGPQPTVTHMGADPGDAGGQATIYAGMYPLAAADAPLFWGPLAGTVTASLHGDPTEQLAFDPLHSDFQRGRLVYAGQSGMTYLVDGAPVSIVVPTRCVISLTQPGLAWPSAPDEDADAPMNGDVPLASAAGYGIAQVGAISPVTGGDFEAVALVEAALPGGFYQPLNAFYASFDHPDGAPGQAISSCVGAFYFPKATPHLAWAPPAPISPAVPLGAGQLDATADAPGTFTYSVAAGQTLSPGQYTLTATFAPADSSAYLVPPAISVPLTVVGAAQAFQAGDVVVYRIGTGAGGLGSTGSPVFLDEVSPGGAVVQSIPLPTRSADTQHRLVASGTATSEGLITRSADGAYLLLTGYDADVAAVLAASAPRVVGRVDGLGNVDTSTALTDAVVGGTPRSAASPNGTDLFISGSTTGLSRATIGSSTSTLISDAVPNLRQVAIADGQLYISTASGAAVRIGAVGTGVPTSAGQTIVAMPGFPIPTSHPYAFAFFDLDAGVPGVDTLYVADDTPGTIQKFCLVGGSWIGRGGVALANARGLTGTVSGGGVTLYATSGGSSPAGGGGLYAVTDATGYDGFLGGAPTLVLNAGANQVFRGVALAPLAPPTTAAQTIAFAPIGDQVYGAPAITLAATASSGLPVSYVVSGPASLVGGSLTITGAGTVSVLAHQDGDGSYGPASAPQSFAVVPAPLTVIARNASMVVGSIPPSFSGIVTGLVAGDTVASLGAAVSYRCAGGSASPLGSYAITPVLAPGNYVLQAPVPGVLAIHAADDYDVERDFSATANPTGAWTYGWVAVPGAELTAYDTEGFIAVLIDAWHDAAIPGLEPAVFSNQTGAPYDSGVGYRFAPGSVILHPGPDGQRSLVRWTAPRGGTYALASAFYAADATSTDVHVLVNGDEVFSGAIAGAGATQDFAQDLTLGAGDTVDFAVGFGGDGGNTSDSTGLHARIALKPLPTLSWQPPAAIIYGQPLDASILNAAATSAGQPVAGTWSYDQAPTTVLPVGLYVLTATFTPDAQTGFAPATLQASVEVVPATLRISVAPQTWVYGTLWSGNSYKLSTTGFIGVPQVTYTGFVNGETPDDLLGTLTFASTYTQTSPVAGSYALTPGGLVSANYAIEFQSAPITLLPKPLTFFADSVNVDWNAPLPPLTFSNYGFVNGETVAVLTSQPTLSVGAVVQGTHEGTYPITITGGVADNYVVTDVAGTLGIGLNFTYSILENGSAQPLETTTLVQRSGYSDWFYGPFGNSRQVGGFDSPDQAAGSVTVQSGAAAVAIGTVTEESGAPLANGASRYSYVTLRAGSNPQVRITSTSIPSGFYQTTVTFFAQAFSPLPQSVPAFLWQFNTDTIIGTVPPDGAGDGALTVTADSPRVTDLYVDAAGNVHGTLLPRDPGLAWPAPAPIVFGTPLDGAELAATAAVAGSFSYAPGAGAILGAGDQTLTATFAPAAAFAADYQTATITTTVTVQPATPQITWSPKPLSTVTPVGPDQGNATSPVPGSFQYLSAGLTLPAGLQVLTAVFTPTDTVDYRTVTVTAPVQVTSGVPVIAWTPAPRTLTYGTALTAGQLDAVALLGGSAVPGTYRYTPPAGTVLHAGAQTLAVAFTPDDAAASAAATATASLTIAPATLVVTADSVTIPVGAPLPVFTASYRGFVAGDSAAALTTPPKVVCKGASSAAVKSFAIAASGAVDADYAISYLPGTLTVALPGNDAFASPAVLTGLTATVTTYNRGASVESGEAAILGQNGGHSLWWSWTAPASGLVTITTQKSSFDTLLAVYTGVDLAQATLVAANDDASAGTTRSQVAFAALAGTTYRITVDGKGGAFGTVAFSLTQVPYPANDAFAAAQVLQAFSGTVTGTTLGATKEAGEPDHAGNAGGASIWYTFTAPAGGGLLAVDTLGSGFDTLLGVYAGSALTALAPIAANDNTTGVTQSRVSVWVPAGVYAIAVDGKGGKTGAVSLHWSFAPAPANDAFTNARPLGGANGSLSATTVGASREGGEPKIAGNAGGASVWWTFTPAQSGTMVLSTAGSGFDTLLGVFTASSTPVSVSGLTPVKNGSQDNISATDLQSRVSILVTAGTPYWVAVDGRNGAQGAITLTWHFLPNDAFANAQRLGSPQGTLTATTVDAGKEAGEPVHAGNAGGASLWYAYTAPAAGYLEIDTQGSSFDTLLAVYTQKKGGTTVSTLVPVAADDDISATDAQSAVDFKVTAGTTYSIAVDGFAAATGQVILNWVFAPAGGG